MQFLWKYLSLGTVTYASQIRIEAYIIIFFAKMETIAF